ncbi:PREDICTED: uncharacterized protein LOC101314212 [Fragaria vesca subsp. vesca]|uniref:uncharacterized protein LOC101314212 n=1 Tax=Fragaria vesca subsp. vesca TaxID=101020 RepID=UPI0002C30651|nr:PREDICTED: uncharacterized protein LOC101314212 [Fragaria vesca subsp. vesca]
MDSIITNHPFTSFIPSPLNPHPKPFTATSSHLKKLKKSFVCFSQRPRSNSRNPRWPEPLSFRKLNPIWVLVPVLQSIRVLASSGKWVSEHHGFGFLQNSGIGIALMSVTTNAKVKISPFVTQLAANPTFVSGMFAWFVAQSMKVVLNFFVEKKWDLRILCASGGMPSSHSALCTALTTSVALCHGVADSLFPVCLGFSLIVMYDATGVRRHAGMQAEVLNIVVEYLFQGHPISQNKLKELLGHTPSQVLAGAVLGIVVACVCCQSSLVAA